MKKNVARKTSALLLSVAVLGGIGVATAAPASAATVRSYVYTDKNKSTAASKCQSARTAYKTYPTAIVGDCIYRAPKGKEFLHSYELTVIF